jgi:protease I
MSDGKDKSRKVVFLVMPREFRDEEFFVPYEMLKKAGFSVSVASTHVGEIISAGGKNAESDMTIDELLEDDRVDQYDAIIVPGGPGSTKYLWGNEDVQNVIRKFHEKGKIVATICYASIVPAEAGLLKNLNATVFPTDEAKKIFEESGVKFSSDGVVTLEEERIITAQGPTFAEEFANAIIEMLKSDNKEVIF